MPPDFSKYGVKQEEKEGINWSEYGIDTAPKASANFEKYITHPWDGQSPAEQALGSSLLDVAKQNRADLLTESPNQLSPREENKARREAQDPKNPVLDFIKDNTVDALASGIDYLRYETKPGQFVDRLGQSAVRTTGATPTDNSTTGNRIADTVADVTGAAAGYFTNPSAVGMGQSFNAFYNNPALQRVAQQAGNLVKNPLGQRALQEGTQEGLSAAAYAVPRSFIQGETSPGEVARNVAIEGALGAVGGAVLPVVGKGLQQAGKGIKTAYNASLESAPVSGFSAFAQRNLQKLRAPKDMQDISQMIDVGGRPAKERSTWETIKTAVIDELEPLRRATEKIGGKNVPIEQNPFEQAWLSRGWRGKADTKLEFGILDESGQKIGLSLKEALDPVADRLDDLRNYAVALRTLEYEDAGLKAGISSELAQQTIEKYAGDEAIQTAYRNLKQYITDMNQSTLVDSGIWSPEKLKQLQEEQPNYIPMFRTQEKGIRDFPQSASNKRIANQKDPVKRRTGSQKPIVDPLESIIKQTYKYQAIAEKNKVMRSLVELAEASPNNGIVEPVKGDVVNQIQKSLDEFLTNPTQEFEKQLKETLDLFNPQTVNGERNVFTVMRNGKAEQWQVNDDQLAKVLAGLNNDASSPLINLIGKATGILKAGLVLAPDFVVKNLLRDQMSAFINSKYGYIPIWDMFSGLSSAISGRLQTSSPRLAKALNLNDDTYFKWMSSGGANGSWVSLERDYLQNQLRRMIRKDVAATVRNKANLIDKLRAFSEVSEQATRLGEFKRGVKKTGNLQKAALASRDVTLDFSRIGSKTKDVNKAVAFFNVAVQSMDKMARQFKERPAKTLGKAALSITVPSAILYALNHNDPRYQELPQYEKDLYWHVFLGDEILKIPKPFELGVIFGTFPERMLQWQAMNDPQAFEGFAKQVVEGFTPSILPTLFVPWIEAFSNKDTFTKAPIVPRREEGLLPEDQFGPYTSQIAKGIGEATGTSPRIVENYITGYTGTLGRYGLQMADQFMKATGRSDAPPKPESGLSTMPGIRSFFSKGLEGSSKSVDEFYKTKEKLTRERTSARKNKKPFEKEGEYRKYNKIGEAISDRQGEIRRILEDPNMDPRTKRERIQELNLMIINLARQAKGEEPIGR